ncbi:PHP domain-containing protein [Anaerobacillus sp. HL2]|nr:PHP domain-containing protein [Anaerobacillus sp. HL2]
MFDYHVHSKISPDSTEMKAACLAAIEKGVKEIAFTDHLDYFYPNCDLVSEDLFD